VYELPQLPALLMTDWQGELGSRGKKYCKKKRPLKGHFKEKKKKQNKDLKSFSISSFEDLGTK